jgi:peroxiredoxin
MRLPFRSLVSCLAFTLAAQLAPAMDSELQSFPVSVRHDMDMEYEYDLHTFELDEPGVITAVVVADGFHPTLQVMTGDDPTSLAQSIGSAGVPLHLTARLEPGSYRLVVVAEPVWEEAASYTMAVDVIPASDLGQPITLEPQPGETRGFRFSNPLPVLGTRLPAAALGEGAAMAELSGGGEGTELVVLDADGYVTARTTTALALGNGGSQLVVTGPFEDQTVTVRTAAAGAEVASEQLTGTLDASSPQGVDWIDRADTHGVEIPSALGAHIEAKSPSMYLDIQALDAEGREIASAAEGDQGFVALDLAPGHPPVASIIVSGRGDTGDYSLTVRSEVPLQVPTSQTATLTVDGKKMVGGASYRLTVPAAGTLRAVSPTGAQLLLLDSRGSWTGASESHSTSENLEVGQQMRVVDETATDADTTEPNQPPLLAGDIVMIEEISGDGEVAMVGRDGHRWAVFTAGMEPVGPTKSTARLEVEVAAGEMQMLVLGDAAGLTIDHVSQLLELAEESLEEGERAQRESPDRMARHTLTVAVDEIVELELEAPELERARVRLRGEDGSELDTAAVGTTGNRLRWLSDRAGKVEVEVLGGADEPASYRVEARRLAGRVTTHELEMSESVPLILNESRDVATRVATAELPKGSHVLVRLQAPEAGRLELAALGADGAPLAVASTRDTGAPELSLVATVGRDGKLTVATASELESEGATLEVIPLAAAPELTLPVEEGDREARELPLAPDFTWAANGGQKRLSDLRGQVVLLEFWASWCGPCRDSLPNVEALHRRYADRGLVVLGVNDEPPSTAAEAATELGLTFATLPDEDDAIGDLFGVDGIPRTVIVGRDGRIVGDFDGAANEEPLRRVVTSALKGAG